MEAGASGVRKSQGHRQVPIPVPMPVVLCGSGGGPRGQEVEQILALPPRVEPEPSLKEVLRAGNSCRASLDEMAG